MINQAAIEGPTRFAWWPDWRGECCAIVASGPSVTRAQVEVLRNRIHVIAIKTCVDLCPWADIVYGCDAPWWIDRKGLPDFKGLRLAYDPKLADFKNIHRIDIDRTPEGDRILVDKAGRVGSGGNSGFQTLNLSVQFGALGILLIGFDMVSKGNSPHWYGRNEWLGASNPVQDNFTRWRTAFEAADSTLRELGVDVVNASDMSQLKSFRRATVEDALRGWSL